ncbi:MAG: family 43 glycosylhydrolase [Bacteroidales bacterium]|nr:family 43 glycosylhydrolase [Candidatus Liminaster caballi]
MTKRILLLLLLMLAVVAQAQPLGSIPYKSFYPGNLWFDTDGNIINAHGGGVMCHDGRYYWYGEHKGEHSNSALVGVTCYSSTDLMNWHNEGIALSVSDDPQSPITRGCILERPKVIRCASTGKFVMYFHLELKGRGYAAANVGIAVADSPTGPFTFVSNGRVNAGIWPLNMTEEQQTSTENLKGLESWSKEWVRVIADGYYNRRDHNDGQMARDMTLYVDDDGRAYHIFASEENMTIQIAELSDDCLGYTGRYVRVDAAGQNEAPAIFKKDGTYYMITSGCTGWAPNAARLLTASSIFGPWTRHDNPCRGKGADLTFQSQSTYILPVGDGFIFMADRWNPDNPIDGRYMWLPIEWEDGLPVLRMTKRWNLENK